MVRTGCAGADLVPQDVSIVAAMSLRRIVAVGLGGAVKGTGSPSRRSGHREDISDLATRGARTLSSAELRRATCARCS